MLEFPLQNAYLFYIIAYLVPSLLLANLLPKRVRFFDRVVLAIPLSIFIVTFSSFLLNLFVGFGDINVYFSLLSVYGLGFYSLYRDGTLEKIKEKLNSISPGFSNISSFKFELNELFEMGLVVLAIAIALLSFFIRIQPISPIYYELDPYYYLYSTIQLIEDGTIPLVDDTAWFPNPSTHRVTPLLAHFNGLVYEFLFNGLDEYKLSYTANLYPPFVFSVMLLLLFITVRNLYSTSSSLITIAFVSINEIFLLKTLSGVFEAQPMGFMALTATIAAIIFSLKFKDMEWFILSAVFMGLTLLASNFFLIALGVFVLSFSYVALKALFEEVDIKKGLAISTALIAVFVLIFEFYRENFSLSIFRNIFITSIPLVLLIVIEKLKKIEVISKYKNLIPFAVIILALIALYTPLGNSIKPTLELVFSVSKYNTVLERTIAEQQQIGESITTFVGKLGERDEMILNSIFAAIFNGMFQIIFSWVRTLGIGAEFIDKEPSFALSILTLAMIISGFKGFILKREHIIPLAVIIVLFTMGGALKAKYGILLSYSFIFSLSVVIGEVFSSYGLIKNILEKLKLNFNFGEKTYEIVLIAISLIVFSSLFTNSIAYSLYEVGGYKKFGESPYEFRDVYELMCSQDPFYCQPLENFLEKPYNQYDFNLCLQSITLQALEDGKDPSQLATGIRIKCSVLPPKWTTAMDFLYTNTEKGARITSWWDYGHWINYFGRRNAVIRNEHSYLNMILDVADAFIMKDEEGLKEVMNKYSSKYVLIDDEIIASPGSVFGGKFYALNYLACAKNNLTNINLAQMNSLCEYENLWETVVVTNQPCVISEVTGKEGFIVAKTVYESSPLSSITPSPRTIPYYCLGTTRLVDGIEIPALYYLNKKTPTGDLVLNKGFLQPTSQQGVFVVLYTKDKVWMVNGSVVSGWEDRKGRFYDSVVYKGFVLGELEGFEKVFDNGGVKIYRLKE